MYGTSRFLTVGLLLFIFIPVLLFICEVILAKKGSKMAIILPVIVLCFAVILGFYPIIVAAIMAVIYLVVNHLNKMKDNQNSEIDKMNINDL